MNDWLACSASYTIGSECWYVRSRRRWQCRHSAIVRVGGCDMRVRAPHVPLGGIPGSCGRGCSGAVSPSDCVDNRRWVFGCCLTAHVT